jgi:BirA family biotin operon repressor/biotin-[acetyl-CoA-carboxylase] ligase
VLGIGLNVTAAPPLEHVTALDAGIGTEEMLARLLPSLDRWLGSPTSDVLAAWRSRDALLGQTVRWQDGSGTAAGIDESGALLVDTESGRVALNAGEVHLHRS